MRSSILTQSRFFSLLWLLLLASLTTTASAQLRPADINDLIGLSGSQLIELDIPNELGGDLEVAVPIEGKLEILELIPRSVRAAEFQIRTRDINGNEIFTDPGPVRTFRGVVTNHKGSDVAGALHIEGLWAHILFSDGTSYWVEPLADRFPGFRRKDHVIYRSEQVLPSDAICGNDNFNRASPLPGFVGGTGCGGDFCIAAIACDADFEFFTANFSDLIRTTNRVELLTNVVNQQYERDVQISHRIVTVLIRDNTPGNADPYNIPTPCAPCPPGAPTPPACTSALNLNTEMATEWTTNQTTIGRDFVHLFTGKTGFQAGNACNIFTVFGRATVIGSICNPISHYSWTANFFAFPGIPNCSTSLSICTDLLAHEWGHQWNACHCDDADCDGTVDSPTCNFTMNPTVIGANLFRPAAITTIQNYRDTLNCLEASVANDKCEDAFPICNGIYIGTTTSATQNGEASCDSSATEDVWYRFTSATGGTTNFTVSGAPGFPLVVITAYGSCPAGSFNEIACDASSNPLSTISVPVNAGETIFIRIAGSNGGTGDFTLTVAGTTCEAPINDQCASPIDICPGEYTGSTEGGTYDATGNCGASNGSPDVWFRYTPLVTTTTDQMVIDTCYSDFDTVIELYNALTTTGAPVCPGNLGAPLICSNNDVCGNGDQIVWPVIAGDSFLIRVSGAAGLSGAFRLSLSGPQCNNDLCANATEIEAGTHFGTLDGASNDGTSGAGGGTPLCGQSDNSPDVYYSFTSPCEGTFFATTCGSNDLHGLDSGLDSVLSIHSSCPADSTNVLDCNDDWSPGMLVTCDGLDLGFRRDSSVSAPIAAGQTVIVRVSHFGGINSSPDQFILNVGVIPNCDDCSTAFDVSSGGSFTGDTSFGTTDGSAASCNSTGPDLWYQFTASCNGILQIDTCGTNDLSGTDNGIDTVLSLHDSCPGTDQNILICNDNWPTSSSIPAACPGSDTGMPLDSALSLPMTEGTTVVIRVGTSGASPPGLFNLNVNFEAPNNDCSDAIDVSGGGSFVGDSRCATTDGSTSCATLGPPDVWYRYTASCDGTMRVDTCGTNDLDGVDGGIDTILSLHESCPGTDLNELNCNDDWFSSSDPTACSGSDTGDERDSFVSLDMSAGETAFIRVTTFQASIGSGIFNLNVNFEVPNNDCSDAIDVSGGGSFTGDTLCATEDGSASCSSSGAPDVWYRYTASDNGTLQVDTCGSNDLSGAPDGIDTILSLHESCPGTDLNELDCNDDWFSSSDPTACSGIDTGDERDSFVSLDMFAGETVFIRVSTYFASIGPGIFNLNVDFQPPSCEAVTALGCTESPVAVQLEWTNNDNYSEIQIYSDLSGLIATIDGDQTSFFDNFPPQGTSTYWVVGVCGLFPAPPSNTCTTSVCPRVEPLTCNVYGSQVFLVWNNPANYTTIQIRLGTLVIATLIGNKNQYLFDAPGPGTYTLCVVGFCGGVEADETCCEVTIDSTEPEFIRGNCNLSGDIDIADVISLLSSLFNGVPLGNCADACDANDDGSLDIADGITLLSFLFIGANPPPPPFPDCGPDPSPDPLDCESFPACR